MAYRVYVTDALRIISENTARVVSGNYIKLRFADAIKPQKEETRTSAEVIEHMKRVMAGIK